MNASRLLAAPIVAALAFLAPADSAWANYTCTGVPKGVAVDVTGGDLLAESIGPVSWPRFCSFRTAKGSIQPDDCKRMYAALLTAQAEGRSVTFWVSDADSSHTSAACSTLTPWQYVTGVYFLRVDN